MTDEEMLEISENVDIDRAGEEMSCFLTSPDMPSTYMFEEIVSAYVSNEATEDFRKGMNKALEIITYRNVEGLCQHMKDYACK